jgi:hypothetical protein
MAGSRKNEWRQQTERQSSKHPSLDSHEGEQRQVRAKRRVQRGQLREMFWCLSMSTGRIDKQTKAQQRVLGRLEVKRRPPAEGGGHRGRRRDQRKAHHVPIQYLCLTAGCRSGDPVDVAWLQSALRSGNIRSLTIWPEFCRIRAIQCPAGCRNCLFRDNSATILHCHCSRLQPSGAKNRCHVQDRARYSAPQSAV